MGDESKELAERLARLKQLQDELNAGIAASEREKASREKTKRASPVAPLPKPEES